jgi:DNA-binding CsgD family transcriptional regulator
LYKNQYLVVELRLSQIGILIRLNTWYHALMYNISSESRHLLNQVPGSIGIKSVDSIYLAGNQYFAKVAGLKHGDDFIGRQDIDLELTAHLADDYVAQDRYVIREQVIFRCLQLRRCADKPYRMFYSVKRPYYDEHNQLIGVVAHGTSLDDSLLRSMAHLLGTTQSNKIVEQNLTILSDFSTKDIAITPRESEVLFYLMRGKTVKEVALLLCVSARTVDSHLINLKNKFNCRTRSQLIELGIELGLYQVIPTSILQSIKKNTD